MLFHTIERDQVSRNSPSWVFVGAHLYSDITAGLAEIASRLMSLFVLEVRSRSTLCLTFALASLLTGTARCQIVLQTHSRAVGRSATPLALPRDSPAPSGRQAEAATITLVDGKLSVDAHNSELRQILDDISRQSGMTIRGDIRDTRVFGHYGPQNPRVILLDLLTGLGYNIIITGVQDDGAPRELLLTDRTATASPSSPPEAVDKEEKRLGPGAIAHPPTQEVDDAPLRNLQHDQKLQHMHEALEKRQEDASH